MSKPACSATASLPSGSGVARGDFAGDDVGGCAGEKVEIGRAQVALAVESSLANTKRVRIPLMRVNAAVSAITDCYIGVGVLTAAFLAADDEWMITIVVLWRVRCCGW